MRPPPFKLAKEILRYQKTLYISLMTADRYQPRILRVAYGDHTAAEVMEESDDSQSSEGDDE